MTKSNVHGGFSQALFFSGSVSIPRFLLDHYIELGITVQEMMLIIHLIAEYNTGNNDRLEEKISKKMGISISEVSTMFKNLKAKGVINYSFESPSLKKSSATNGYDITGLIDQLFELWGINQFKQITALETENVKNNEKNCLPKIIEIFERELGRPLTGFECEHIEKWLLASYSEELIIEALRRGVSAGIRNFRYLDSILREWEKKGIKTLLEVEAEDESFQSRQEKRKDKDKNKNKKKNISSNKYDDIYL